MKLCFIIACHQRKSYFSYLPFTIKNIQNFYPEATIILVDNDSEDPTFFQQFLNDQVQYLKNTTVQRFETGAYNAAISEILNKNLEFDYYIAIQDTMVVVNKFNFEEYSIKACSIGLIRQSRMDHWKNGADTVLKQLGLYDSYIDYIGCWCSSWICNHESLCLLNYYTKYIPISTREDSMIGERYLQKILYEINGKKNDSIEGFEDEVLYECHTEDPLQEKAKGLCKFVMKRAQQKV